MQRHVASSLLTVTALLAMSPAEARHPLEFTYGLLDTFVATCADEDGGCAEISAFDASSSTLFTTDASGNSLRSLRVDEGGRLSERAVVDLAPYGGGPNSVAVSDGLVAVAVEADVKTDPGRVVVFDADGTERHTVTVGALPDMLTFTPDGRYLVVANEGEPNDDYTIDPEGSVSIIDTADWTVRTAGFAAFEGRLAAGVRVFGPGASVAEDLEPEYVAVSADSRTAWVTLQENNALAIVDIPGARVREVKALGFKRHDWYWNAFDASDRDGGEGCRIPLADPGQCIRIRPWPVLGMYQPDGIDAFRLGRYELVITANEGDARDYDGFSEEARVGDDDIALDPSRFPDAEALRKDGALGRLKITTTLGDRDGDGDFDALYAYGGRSFSIRDSRGRLIYDSGGDIERRLAALQRAGANVWVDDRSDDKGPEPESVVVGELGGATLAFIGLERASGVIVYDVSWPFWARYVGYIDVRAFDDVGPEGLEFIRRTHDTGWLVVTSEVSNSTSIYEVSARR